MAVIDKGFNLVLNMPKKLPRYHPVAKGFDYFFVRVITAALVIFMMTFGFGIQTARAQGIPKNIDPELLGAVLGSGMTPEQSEKVRPSPLDKAREISDDSGLGIATLGSSQSEETEEPYSLIDEEPYSLIERSFIRRIWGEQSIRQFGYKNFRQRRAKAPPFTGAISESYVLGIGDNLVVTYQGREEDSFTSRIDREGQLVLPKLPPIPAAGRTFGQLRSDIELRVASTLVGTNVFVSLGTVRAISVYVVGEVQDPGLHHLTSLSTIVDALVDAGGILKTGTLRQIEITRGSRRFLLDAYDLLISGGPNYDLSLQDGDRIFVPTIAAVAAVAGDVKRPGIYELPYGRVEVSVAELIRLSGDPIVPRGNRIVLVSMDAAGRAITSEPEDLNSTMVRAGEYVQVISSTGLEGGLITVQGHINNPGSRSLIRNQTLGGLLRNPELFRPDPYLLFAALRRTDPGTQTTSLFPINLRPVLSGEQDIELKNKDILSVFSNDDIEFLISPQVQAVIRGRSDQLESVGDNCPGLDALAGVMDGEREDRFARAKYFSRRFGEIQGEALKINQADRCPDLFREDPQLLSLLLEYSAILGGEVRRPGIYPVTEGVQLVGVLAAAGGLTVEADVKTVEMTSTISRMNSDVSRRSINLSGPESARTTLSPGDTIRVNALVSGQDRGPVILGGEVRRPGIYNIRRGERLSEIITRAGGLTEQAFPRGTVFTRESARAKERQSFDRLADQLQLSLASNLMVVGGYDGGSVGEAAIAAQQLVDQLRNTKALGRVVIEADPAILTLDPSRDTILEPDDQVYVPKRPNWIAVSGAVLNPGTVQFAPGADARDYIKMAGGFAEAADEGFVFVVYPDGRAQPVGTSFWNFEAVQLIPGSSIVVPMDATPFRFLPIAKEVTTIISQLSLAAASLSVINRD